MAKTVQVAKGNDTKTHIIFILDASGSMITLRNDAIGGFNTLLEDQKNEPGLCTLTLVQFNTSAKVDYSFKELDAIEPLNEKRYRPSGGTALLDAIGTAVTIDQKKIADMSDEEKPDLVVLAIMTDGEENSSREFSLDQIKETVEKLQSENDWKVLFLGANQDAFDVATGYGITSRGAANMAYTSAGIGNAMIGASNLIGRTRAIRSHGGDVQNEGYTVSELDAMATGGPDALKPNTTTDASDAEKPVLTSDGK